MGNSTRSRSRNRRSPESRDRRTRENRSRGRRYRNKSSSSNSRDRSPHAGRSRSQSRNCSSRYKRSRNQRSRDRRSRGRCSRSHSRSSSPRNRRLQKRRPLDRRSSDRGSRTTSPDSKRRCRSSSRSQCSRAGANRGERCVRSAFTPPVPPEKTSKESLNSLMSRLDALERRSHKAIPVSIEPISEPVTNQIVEAIQSLKSVSIERYYVSNFDPSIHDVDSWFNEVDQAKLVNKWDDRECLSRVGNCLKGDAKSWLNEWVSNDRSWTNFKNDFKSLCVKKIDAAGILFEVMSTNCDKFRTYAEYARRTLLRLRIVKGLSEDLVTEIVLRGITDPQIKAAATNANLKPADLVNYLSTFIKPSKNTNVNVNNRAGRQGTFKRDGFDKSQGSKKAFQGTKCYGCGDLGHKQVSCPKQSKPSDLISEQTPVASSSDTKASSNAKTCAYCKKSGHDIKSCFAKQRVDQQRNINKKVNLCSIPSQENSDLVVGVIQGIPVDILIDSGAIEVSLISSSIVNHFSCARKPTNSHIKGVSKLLTPVTSYVTLTIELDGISLEVDLLVVPDECMNAPLVIGTDVLNRDGILFLRTKHSKRLIHNSNPLIVSSVESNTQPEIKTSLTGGELIKLKAILEKYSDHMISGTATSAVNTGSMHIRLNSDVPVYYRPYKMSHSEKLKVRDIIQDLLSKGIIRESESPYASPVLLVKKKDGSDRMCVDFRALNKITIKDRYPLPLIDDHVDRLGKCRFFTTLDMATGFHQIRLDEESVPLTGFVTSESHYEYLKMPYGLANAPIVYQRIISTTLHEFIESGKVLVYIDDCLILSNTVDEGLQTLSEVLCTLTKAGFSINLKKCSFLCTKIEYLGRVISNGEVRPSPSKVEALVCSQPPQNVKQVRQFLGLAGYFRKYIKDYSTKTACIAGLTRKNVEFLWGPDQERVRQDILSSLTSAPVLSIFDPSLPTEVHTDASSLGYGAVLMQTHTGDVKRVVAYYSQVTKGAESKYHSYEFETLAVVKSLRHFRHYLVGMHFTVVTDCNALKATQNKRDLLPRVARWWIYLQDFNFTISYRKGAMLPHADYLSRNPSNSVNNIERPRNWAQVAQAGDDETRNMIHALNQGEFDASRYHVQNQVLYYRYTPVGQDSRLLCYIPKGQRLSLLRVFHDEHGHIDSDKTLDLILRHFWFPGLRTFVKKYIRHCITCLAHKRVPRAPLQPITSWPKPDVPFDTLHFDVLGPLPESKEFKHIMLVVDAFTKYCLLTPIHRQDFEELKRVCETVISLFGTPRLIVTDRGRMFESSGFKSWMRVLGIELHHITAEMHHANGQVERYARTVLNMLRIEVNYKKTDWAEELWKLQLILNITQQKTTQTSALNLLMGHENTTPAIRVLVRDITLESTMANRESRMEGVRQRTAERLTQNQMAMDARTNQNRCPPRVFQEGDVVFVIKYAQSKGKLDHGMRGPYRVVRILPHDRYELKLLSGAYGKTTYAAAQYMVPWRGEWTPESCSMFFEADDNIEDDDPAEPIPPGLPLTQVQSTPSLTDDPVPGPSRTPCILEAESSRGNAMTDTD